MATLKLVFGFVILGFAVLVCVKLIPPFFANYEFEDAIKTEALQSTYSTRTENDVRTTVLKQARDLDIALDPKQVRVVRVGTNGNGSLTIEADYSVPVDFPGYSTTLDFHPSTKNKAIF